MGVQEEIRSFSVVPSLQLFRFTQGYVWMVHQLFNFGSVCWKRCHVKQSVKGNLENHKRDKIIPSPSHFENGVF